MQWLLAQRVINDSAFIDQARDERLQESVIGHGCMRREVLRLSDGSFTVAFAAPRKLKKTRKF